MIRPAFFFALASLTLSISATASEPAAETSAEKAETPTVEKQKRICRRVDSGMGTRMSSKVCKTAEEWKAEYAADRQEFEDGRKN